MLKKLVYRKSNRSEHGYNYTDVHVSRVEMCTLQYAIEGCVDNKAGYGDPEVAKELEVEFRKALEQGYTHIYQYNDNFSATYSWMHASSGGYCECKVTESRQNYKGLLEAAHLWERAAKKYRPGHPPHNYSFEDPSVFCDTLDKLGAISSEQVLRYDTYKSIIVYKLTAKQARTNKVKNA